MSIKSNGFIIGGQRVALPVDPTLTISGDAADAKVVGDKCRSLTLGVDPNDHLVYIYVDGQKQGLGVPLGGGGGDVEIRYNVTYTLPHATSSNRAATVPESSGYETVIAAASGYRLSTVVVTMGGNPLTGVYDPETGLVRIEFVRGNITIEAVTEIMPIDLLDVKWANYAISCGQSTNSYNAWAPHNLQYDEVNGKWLLLQCHANKHVNQTYTTWTLSEINPYDPTDVTNIPIPTNNRLGMLFVENGVWWLFARYTPYIYRSSDQGETWETITLDSNLPRLFGIYKVGSHYFAGDDTDGATSKRYFHSTDLIHWEAKYFSSDLGYDCLAETTFCEFQGKFWAFNRSNDEELGHPVILYSEDEGTTWQVFSDQMLHGYNSTVSCLAFKSYIMIANIDRMNGYIYYDVFDGETCTTLKSWHVPQGGSDFHTINIATNYADTIVMTFMHSTPWYGGDGGLYYPWNEMSCDNVMLVGSTHELPSITKRAFNTASELTTYLNANCVNGIREDQANTFRWKWDTNNQLKLEVLRNGSWAKLASNNTFFDEIEMPLGFVNYRHTEAHDIKLKNGKKVVKPWHNNYTPPLLYDHYYYPARIAIFYINNVRYEYGVVRWGDLPILIRVDYEYNLSGSYADTYTDFVNQDWQETLGFRKVFNVSATVAQCAIATASQFTETSFALFEYVPAPTEEAGS